MNGNTKGWLVLPGNCTHGKALPIEPIHFTLNIHWEDGEWVCSPFADDIGDELTVDQLQALGRKGGISVNV